ncbi:MAG: transglutaminase [Ruminococcus sp.]|nr:transglutaminase [Ruminococcus sp.]
MSEKKSNIAGAAAVGLALALVCGGAAYLFSGGELGKGFSAATEKITIRNYGEDFSDAATGITVNYNEADGEKDGAKSPEELGEVSIPYAADYFLSYLSEKERLVCSQIYSGFRSFETDIDITDGVVRSEDICKFIVLCTSCAPEFSYIGQEYSVSVDSEGYVMSIEVNFTRTPEEAAQRYDKTADNIDRILSGISPDMSDYDKFLYIHDEIVKNCVYDETAENCYTAYGCLTEGRAVCEGYSKALLMLCEKAGIGCLPVIGQGIDDGEATPHIWNKVLLDGQWYCTDLTWDDPVSDMGGEYYRYDYFALTDAEFAADHSMDENMYLNYPQAVSEEANYYKRNGFFADSSESCPQTVSFAVNYAMDNGLDYARIKCSDRAVFDSCVNDIFIKEYENGNARIFSILKESAERHPESGYSYGSYSIIKNEETFTLTVKLASE